MFEKELKELEIISQAVGNLPDYVQGGGGNTSVKLDGEIMAVKASGFRLNQVTAKEGYALINYKNIKGYFESVDINKDTDFEKESTEFVKKNIVEIDGYKSPRPSVEAGFHSILKKYVIHTHPVYSNILCCSENGEELVKEAFKGKDYNCLWVPYIKPGFHLTLKIKSELESCAARNQKYPEVIFMENHGLVVTTDNYRECIELHKEVNDTIKEYLGIRDEFPEVKVKKVDDSTYISDTSYLTDFFKGSKITLDYFNTALYPDQLVYLNGNISVNTGGSKLNIDTATGAITYKTSSSEANTMEETLLGFIYVMRMIGAKGFKIKTMPEEETNFIKNWESEKYRQSLLKSMENKGG